MPKKSKSPKKTKSTGSQAKKAPMKTGTISRKPKAKTAKKKTAREAVLTRQEDPLITERIPKPPLTQQTYIRTVANNNPTKTP